MVSGWLMMIDDGFYGSMMDFNGLRTVSHGLMML